MWALTILAIAGLLLDLFVHISTFFGCNPQDWIQPDWLARLLFLGSFLAIALAVVVISDRREKRAKQQGIILSDKNPPWFAAIIWLTTFYAIFNFFNYSVIDMRRFGGDPERMADGSYVVVPSHGRPDIPITKDQYDLLRRREARGATGAALVFYLQIVFELLSKPRGARSRIEVIAISITSVRNDEL